MKNNFVQRPIEFRVWDSENKKFITNVGDTVGGTEDLYLSLDGNVQGYDGMEIGFPRNSQEDRFIVQQFTGLLDKNGKKIFEGDIVKFKGSFKGYNWFVFYNTDKCAFRLVDSSDNAFWRDIDGEKNIQILGNVLENPELIK